MFPIEKKFLLIYTGSTEQPEPEPEPEPASGEQINGGMDGRMDRHLGGISLLC